MFLQSLFDEPKSTYNKWYCLFSFPTLVLVLSVSRCLYLESFSVVFKGVFLSDGTALSISLQLLFLWSLITLSVLLAAISLFTYYYYCYGAEDSTVWYIIIKLHHYYCYYYIYYIIIIIVIIIIITIIDNIINDSLLSSGVLLSDVYCTLPRRSGTYSLPNQLLLLLLLLLLLFKSINMTITLNLR